MINRRNDFLGACVAKCLERFEVHCWEMHFVEDDLPIVGPEFDKYSVEQLVCMAGI